MKQRYLEVTYRKGKPLAAYSTCRAKSVRAPLGPRMVDRGCESTTTRVANRSGLRSPRLYR